MCIPSNFFLLARLFDRLILWPLAANRFCDLYRFAMQKWDYCCKKNRDFFISVEMIDAKISTYLKYRPCFSYPA